MGKAKDIQVRPISAKDANRIVKTLHYSGKVVNNSQLHFGVFMNGRCGGAMQLGPSLDKRRMLGLVEGTGWNEFIELNRMAFADWLPRNSESRAIGVVFRLIRRQYPQLKWVVSFADGTQCGDGTIYRAAGFFLTGIKKNTQIWCMPDGEVATRLCCTDTRRPARRRLLSRVSVTKGKAINETGAASMKPFINAGAYPLPGFQLRYIYFLDPSYRNRLAVPILPFSEIDRCGARMYKGEPLSVTSIDSDAPVIHTGEGGAMPTVTLQSQEA